MMNHRPTSKRWLRWTQAFNRFLRRRRSAHFGRPVLQDTIARHAPRDPTPGRLTQALLDAARDTPQAALARLGSGPQGLGPAEVARRRAASGPNEVAHEPPLPAWRHLWQCYQNPFNLLLSALAGVSWASGDLQSTTVIGSMVLLSTGIRFVQEGRSNRAADALKALVGNTASVIRSPVDAAQEIALRELVPGDVVALSAGDMIPADCRLLTSRDLFVAQAAMTGESLPVEKFAQRPDGAEGGDAADASNPLTQPSLVFMGTNVVSGAATALVVATGSRTYFGTLAGQVTAAETAPNAFQAGVNSVSWLLIRFALVMVPVVLLINGITKGDWLQAVLFALSVAVGLTPEMLPMIVTTTLAKGAVALSRRKVVVKRLDAIQNFGAMDVLCTDKTGTLTQDQIALAQHTDAFGQPSQRVLGFAFLNSHYQTGLKNLLDHAVLANVDLAEELKLEQAYRKIDEIPFDFQRRRMSVVVAERDAQGEHHELICKGAVEEVLAVCSQVDGPDGSVAELNTALLARVQAVSQAFNQDGLRVVAVAMKELPPDQTVYRVADEAGLRLVGFIAFLDPPKDSAAPALAALASHGVQVKVLTGDNELVTARVCRQVGLDTSAGVLLGAQIEALDDAELNHAVERHAVFAKLNPLHKERIVRALKAQGHVVGFMGDGINDAPALRAADIGISVDTAVDIAKEAADIILLEKSLLVLDEGVVQGRSTFSNMLKYIRMTASSNFGNVLSVLVASAWLPFLPMLPLHLLVQNLLYDFAQTGLPFDNVDADLVSHPLAWHPADIGRFMLSFGPVSSVFDIATFALMWWGFGAQTAAQQGLFQSAWFVVGLVTQTLVVHMLRSPRLPFVQTQAARPLTVMTLLIVALGLWLPMGPAAHLFKLQPLPPAFFPCLLALLLGYAGLTTLVKRWWVRRWVWQ